MLQACVQAFYAKSGSHPGKVSASELFDPPASFGESDLASMCAWLIECGLRLAVLPALHGSMHRVQ